MKSNVCIFGSNSILAKNFIQNYRNNFNLIGIQREFNNQKNNESIKIIKFNLGAKYYHSQNNELLESLSSFDRLSFKTFIIFSWAGKPRQVEEEICNMNSMINNNIFNNIFNISKTFRPNQIIFISSSGAIYDQNSKSAFDESYRPNPSTAYGYQKLEIEEKLNNFCKNDEINLTILRVSSAYGYDPNFPDNGVLNNWLFNAKNNKPIKVYNSLESSINFISFTQISEAINICINKGIYGLYNLGSNESTKLKYILELVKLISKKKNIEVEKLGDSVRNFYLNTNLFKSKANIIFEDQIKIEAKKIYRLMN